MSDCGEKFEKAENMEKGIIACLPTHKLKLHS